MSSRTQRDASQFAVNGVRVSVSEKPIEVIAGEGGLDAIVSSDDTSLSMGGGVSRSILRAAGEGLLEEVRTIVPLRLGEVGVTFAGRLPVRYILHAAVLEYELPVKPSERTIRFAAENVFRRCELLGVRRLAMPALGTGAAQFSANDAARLVLSALAEHSTNITTLTEVIFSLPDHSARRSFSEYILCSLSPGGAIALGMDWKDTQMGVAGPAASPAAPRPRSRARTTRTAGSEPGKVDSAERVKGSFWGWFVSRRRSVSEDETVSAAPSRVVPQVPGEPAVAPAVPIPNRPLVNNRYVLLEELGRGGMGIVYLAWDIVLRHTVAIKTLRPGEQVATARADALRREAALQIGLLHEGIVRLLNFEPWDQTVGPYIIMEYLDWTSGEQWIAEAGLSGLPVGSVLTIGVRLCEALAYAHAAHVFHGDIKPSNIFIDPTGTRAKLADFGIARVLGAREQSALVTKLIGTIAYMAPEQKKLGAKVGPRTDIYLLARTLADFVGARVRADGSVELPSDSATQPAVSALLRGLESEPEKRPTDAEEFGQLLTAALAMVA